MKKGDLRRIINDLHDEIDDLRGDLETCRAIVRQRDDQIRDLLAPLDEVSPVLRDEETSLLGDGEAADWVKRDEVRVKLLGGESINVHQHGGTLVHVYADDDEADETINAIAAQRDALMVERDELRAAYNGERDNVLAYVDELALVRRNLSNALNHNSRINAALNQAQWAHSVIKGEYLAAAADVEKRERWHLLEILARDMQIVAERKAKEYEQQINRNLVAMLEDGREERDNVDRYTQNMEASVTRLATSLHEYAIKLSQAEHERDDHKSHIVALERGLACAIAERDDHKSHVAFLESDFRRVIAERDSAKLALDTMAANALNLGNENAELRSTCATLRADLSEATDTVEGLTTRNNYLEHENSEWFKSSVIYADTLKRYQERITGLRTLVDDLRRDTIITVEKVAEMDWERCDVHDIVQATVARFLQQPHVGCDAALAERAGMMCYTYVYEVIDHAIAGTL